MNMTYLLEKLRINLEKNPELRTRTSIAHAIARNNGILWQNIYSGIFKDLDEVLKALEEAYKQQS